MKMLIDIPEIEYNTRKVMGYFSDNSKILKAVANGIPLPRRLIDADKFIDSLKGIERLHIDDELRNNILSALYTNILEAESEG